MNKRILTIFAALALLAGAAVASAESGTVAVGGDSLAETITAVSLDNVTLDGTDKTTTDTSNSWTAADATGTGAGWHLTIAATDFASAGDDVQEVYTDGVTGTFTLTYDSEATDPINEDDSAATVETRLEANTNITDVSVSGTGTEADPWVIQFVDPVATGMMTTTDTTLVSTIRRATIDISQADQQFQITLSNGNIVVVAGNDKPTSLVTTQTDIADDTVTFLSAETNQGMGSYTLNPDLELEVRAEVHADPYTSAITVTVITAP